MAPAIEPAPEVAKKNTDTAIGEYKGMSEAEKKALLRHQNAMGVSVDFCQDYFDKFIRMKELYGGVIPEELDCTFSKVMLSIPFSIVQNELPRRAAALFSGEDFFNLQAEDLELEASAEDAKQWLLYQVRNRNRIFPRCLDTLTRTCIYGTGYRAVTHTPIIKRKEARVAAASFAGIPYHYQDEFDEKVVNGIFAENVDIWQIMPAPNGNQVNMLDPEAEEAVEWLHWIQYMSRAKLKAIQKAKFANARAIQAMFDAPVSKSTDQYSIDFNYRQRANAASLDFSRSDWIQKQRAEAKEGLEGRFRCVWTFFRDKWMLIGENQFVLYDGPPLLDWFPIAKYCDTPDPDSFYGTGLLETCEDVILAYLLNFNMRKDYLAMTLFPTTYMRDDLAASISTINPNAGPYGINLFSRKIQDIQKAIWRDRFPEISPLSFMEETTFKQLLQEVTAQPNYMKGMGGDGTLANETATGIVSLIEEGTARSTLRALNTEYTGLQDELRLILKWGKKYVYEDQVIRSENQQGGFPAKVIPYAAIDDGYGIELMGTRSLTHKNEMVKQMMSALPMLVNNPNVPNQKELLLDFVKKLDAFPNPKKYFEPGNMGGGMQGMMGGAQPQGQAPTPGMGGTPTMQNEQQAVAGRTGQRGGTPPGFSV